jgi:hypothetical protein
MGSAKTTRPALARTLQRPRLSKPLDKSSSRSGNFPGWIITDVASLVVWAHVLAAQEKWSESRQMLAGALAQARQADAPLAIFMALAAGFELILRGTALT